ncbi:flagellar FlbD family protein [Paenibacillus mucilaginosus]|uniref:Flagellar protein D n=3 Tax=Paenibacillus mucilaginosus TaxID=61624 RepID=H6NQ48_9BACL|nr:flagellar FlbD family protein [Paenibacillus mucilaginosus]AEI44334.1 Flagellar protein D [Paenibacillus mucilaginosus KNP414]AFC31872.1 Flagellar protein D [Paenibacillus mucilaginosus 3016]AFH64229.1 flagellar protein D [Paenibacillus mucilaginosus K02]MCG7217612.1 flagellar FlbD family protein [Paenibacillus mucilaginosus]WDM25730.1 flagellar FlbD family protein [Paenibacillus mucilaginosus]
MVLLTRLNGNPFYLNAFLIESIEATPDTMISLVNGKKIMVLEPASDVVLSIQQFLQTIGVVGSTIKTLDTEGS